MNTESEAKDAKVASAQERRKDAIRLMLSMITEGTPHPKNISPSEAARILGREVRPARLASILKIAERIQTRMAAQLSKQLDSSPKTGSANPTE